MTEATKPLWTPRCNISENGNVATYLSHWKMKDGPHLSGRPSFVFAIGPCWNKRSNKDRTHLLPGSEVPLVIVAVHVELAK